MLAGGEIEPGLLRQRAGADRLSGRHVLGDAVVEHLPGAGAELGHVLMSTEAPATFAGSDSAFGPRLARSDRG